MHRSLAFIAASYLRHAKSAAVGYALFTLAALPFPLLLEHSLPPVVVAALCLVAPPLGFSLGAATLFRAESTLTEVRRVASE